MAFCVCVHVCACVRWALECRAEGAEPRPGVEAGPEGLEAGPRRGGGRVEAGGGYSRP